jgi:hypothetical protein
VPRHRSFRPRGQVAPIAQALPERFSLAYYLLVAGF